MDFELTDEQLMVRETARGFAEKEVKPVAAKLDREGVFPDALVRRLGELGFMGIFMPAEFGGVGLDFLCYVIAIEEISKVWASLGTIMNVSNSAVCDPIWRFGTDAQRQRFLPRLARGEILGCYAITEPGAGSDAAGIQTRARKRDGAYVLDGSKIFITNGSRADLAIVFAVTEPGRGGKGISAFLVEKGTKGFDVGRVDDKLGLRGSDTAELFFRDCVVPEENVLGRAGEGFRIAMASLDGGRISIAAQAVGIAQAGLEEALSYAKQRRQFGRPIADFQAIQWMLADMATEIDAARSLTHRAAWMRQQGRQVTMEASMAKLFASEAANRAAYKAVQIFGGSGFLKDFAVERFYRDARVTTLYEGTSEIQRLIISRHLVGGERPAHES